MKATSALSLALAAGIASTAAAANTPTKLDPTAGQIKHVAHIYFNIGTGEKSPRSSLKTPSVQSMAKPVLKSGLPPPALSVQMKATPPASSTL